MLAYFEQPDIQTKILQYITERNIDIDQLDEGALTKMME
jgi:hypothetical protein